MAHPGGPAAALRIGGGLTEPTGEGMMGSEHLRCLCGADRPRLGGIEERRRGTIKTVVAYFCADCGALVSYPRGDVCKHFPRHRLLRLVEEPSGRIRWGCEDCDLRAHGRKA